MPKLAVLGHPVSHSRSPAMQTAALAALGMGDWSYRAIDVAPGAFEMTVRELASLGYAGVNVTVPHKEAALALADEASEASQQIGAANTLVFSGKEIEAHNTDADGLLSSLPDSPLHRRALVLGAGGAARAVVWALLWEGAQVAVWNRTPERAETICAELGGKAILAPRQEEYDLIVNTSAAGMGGEDPFEHLPLRPDLFHRVPGRCRHGLWRVTPARCSRRRRPPAPPPSTASRSSSSRGRDRWKSGPGASPTST